MNDQNHNQEDEELLHLVFYGGSCNDTIMKQHQHQQKQQQQQQHQQQHLNDNISCYYT